MYVQQCVASNILTQDEAWQLISELATQASVADMAAHFGCSQEIMAGHCLDAALAFISVSVAEGDMYNLYSPSRVAYEAWQMLADDTATDWHKQLYLRLCQRFSEHWDVPVLVPLFCDYEDRRFRMRRLLDGSGMIVNALQKRLIPFVPAHWNVALTVPAPRLTNTGVAQ